MTTSRVSLITLHRVKNYGSVLQTFATQRLIQELGSDVEIVDYWRPDLSDDIEDILSRSRWANNLLTSSAFKVARGGWARRNQHVFNGFVERRLCLTAREYRSPEELEVDPPIADLYVVGSDQVWNNDYNVGGSEPFFLKFVPPGARKVAFASSLGKPEATDAELRLIRSELPNFSHISVREASTRELLGKSEIRASHVLDPTLTLSREAWTSELDLGDGSDSGYLLVYQLNSSRTFDETVERIAASLRLPVKRIRLKTLWPSSRTRVVQPEVEEFVGLFAGASHVVTDSFHGTAFSHIFQVPFNVVMPGKYSERIASMVALSGLGARIATGNEIDLGPIDWQSANERLERARSQTVAFLRAALTNDRPVA